MRILVLTPTFLPAVGGAEIVLYEVYRRLAERHSVLLLTPRLSPRLLRQYSQGSDRFDVPFEVRRYEDRWTLMRLPAHRLSLGALPPFSLSAVAATRRAVRDFAPDVLNAHYLMPTGLAAAVAGRWLGVPTVMTLNGRDVPGPGVPPLWRWWQRALLRLATEVTYVSGYCRDAIYGPGRGRGRIIYNGVDIPAPPGDGRSLRQRLGLGPDGILVFTLGRLAAEKRVDVVLRAFGRFLEDGADGVLLVAGTGPERGRLEALAARLGIAEHVRFAGFVPNDELASCFDACDLFVFHSTYETFGIVVAQAMSHGKPVVTARNTALPEVVGDAGLLADGGDWRGFAEAIARLAGDPELRDRLGRAGRQRAAALFGWDRIAAAYEDVLERAAATGSAAHRAAAGETEPER